MHVEGRNYRTVWMEGRQVKMIEQRLLPHRFEIYSPQDHRATAEAIRSMIVRGAPALGQAAAYGMVQVIQEAPSGDERGQFIQEGFELLRATRPTAQNLFYTLDRVRNAALTLPPDRQAEAAREEADRIADEEVEACRRIGEAGAELIRDGDTVLTHCNAGWLACVDWGTALAPIYVAHRQGKRVRVYADETRPRMQGANLTAWELMQEGVECHILADNAAGLLMQRGEVALVITGADRVAANGDAANKIGTYEKALLARENDIPFYVAAPLSTFDAGCVTGAEIPIEERDADEVLYTWGLSDAGERTRVRTAPPGAQARNPAFDVTPAAWIRGLITEWGILEPTTEAIAAALSMNQR